MDTAEDIKKSIEKSLRSSLETTIDTSSVEVIKNSIYSALSSDNSFSEISVGVNPNDSTQFDIEYKVNVPIKCIHAKFTIKNRLKSIRWLRKITDQN